MYPSRTCALALDALEALLERHCHHSVTITCAT